MVRWSDGPIADLGRPGPRRRWFALALLILLLAPIAAADHVFSHRVLVVGRLIDAEGRPAAGVPVNVTFQGIQTGGRCFDSKAELTGPKGDYEVCRHTHALAPNATVTVRAGNASRAVALDPDLRHAVASFELDAASAHDLNGEREWARTFLVAGRVFSLNPEAENVEGVSVNATPIFGNITAEMRAGGALVAMANTTPDEHGRYKVDLNVTEVPAGAVVVVRIGGDRGEEAVTGPFRRADINVVRDLRLFDGPGDDAPGSAPAPLGPALALAALALVALARRR